MRRLPLLLLLGCLPAGLALAEGCHVNSRTSSAAVTGIETESCYEFVGMPAEALDWSCSNESKDMTSTRKQRVAQCPGGEQARWTRRAWPTHAPVPVSRIRHARRCRTMPACSPATTR